MVRHYRHTRFIAAVLVAAAVVSLPVQVGRAAGPAAMLPIRIAFSTWTGYGPLVVGVDTGIFKKYGLNVSYQVVEDPNARFAAFKAGSLDGIATTVDTFTRQAARGARVLQVFGIDRSVGGDGIVSIDSITSIKQLKGKTVAVNVGSTSEFFLAYVLQQNHMSINDVNIQDMPDSGVAGSTFRAGKVDVAVTWEPWLSRASKRPHGHVLISSKSYPNIIVDVFGFRTDFVKAHPAAVSTFIKAYYAAVAKVNAGDSAAMAAIEKYTGENQASVKADLTTVKLMDLADSKAYFGTPAKPGPIYDIARTSAKFWLSIKKIDKMPDINAIIDSSYLQKM